MTRIIIDCDPGTDDAIALWLALASPELEVALVTVVGGNVGLDRTLPNARAIVGLTGADVPVVAGADRPLLGRYEDAAHVHGDNGLGGLVLPDGPPATPGIAVDAMRALLRAEPPGSVTLVGLGPATNLGLLFATDPDLASRLAEVVLMTGAVSEGNITPSAEFNAYNDPEALDIVLGGGVPVTLATLDVTMQALCLPEHVARLRARGGGRSAAAAISIFERPAYSPRTGGKGHEQHDATAIMWLVAPHLFTHRPAFARMDLAQGPSRGRTVIDRWDRLKRAPNVRLLETLDPDGFFDVLIERLAKLRSPPGNRGHVATNGSATTRRVRSECCHARPTPAASSPARHRAIATATRRRRPGSRPGTRPRSWHGAAVLGQRPRGRFSRFRYATTRSIASPTAMRPPSTTLA
jgi:purine nucleosidase